MRYRRKRTRTLTLEMNTGWACLRCLLPGVGTFDNTGIHHIVPDYLTMFPDRWCRLLRPVSILTVCSMKQVEVFPAKNAAADFFMFTAVPRQAGLSVLRIMTCLLSSGPSALYWVKAATAWIPVSFRDWQDNEVARVYADERGAYNALLPSTFTVNPPIPTGVSPI